MEERWLPVVGFEGYYEVSDLGGVRSLPRRGRGNRQNRIYGGKMLKGSINPNGYPYVTLCIGVVQTKRQVHQIVMEAFAGPPPKGCEVRHGPSGKLDARLSNLCYGSRSENMHDRVRDGQDNRGERSGHAKLTWPAVADIRRRKAAGEMQSKLADEFGVCRQTITFIIQGKTWAYPPQ